MRQLNIQSIALLVQDSFNNVEEKDLEYYYDVATEELKMHEEPGHIKTQGGGDETNLPNLQNFWFMLMMLIYLDKAYIQ
jgi:hypothetical protein